MRKYLTNTIVESADYKRTGQMPAKNKIFWHLDLDFNRIDEQQLEKQIWRTLKGQGIESGYDKFT